ncbi:MAG: 50S ribosomal protein L9 [Patescibacteria group bacterium]
MKVILLQDVPRVGRKYEVKNVNDGYARNFLIPKKLVVIATTANVQAIEKKKKQIAEERAIQEDILTKNIESLDGIKITYKTKANEKGHLFAAIQPEQISKILKEQHHIDIPSEIIELEHPIKSIGEYRIKVRDKQFITIVT